MHFIRVISLVATVLLTSGLLHQPLLCCFEREGENYTNKIFNRAASTISSMYSTSSPPGLGIVHYASAARTKDGTSSMVFNKDSDENEQQPIPHLEKKRKRERKTGIPVTDSLPFSSEDHRSGNRHYKSMESTDIDSLKFLFDGLPPAPIFDPIYNKATESAASPVSRNLRAVQSTDDDLAEWATQHLPAHLVNRIHMLQAEYEATMALKQREMHQKSNTPKSPFDIEGVKNAPFTSRDTAGPHIIAPALANDQQQEVRQFSPLVADDPSMSTYNCSNSSTFPDLATYTSLCAASNASDPSTFGTDPFTAFNELNRTFLSVQALQRFVSLSKELEPNETVAANDRVRRSRGRVRGIQPLQRTVNPRKLQIKSYVIPSHPWYTCGNVGQLVYYHLDPRYRYLCYDYDIPTDNVLTQISEQYVPLVEQWLQKVLLVKESEPWEPLMVNRSLGRCQDYIPFIPEEHFTNTNFGPTDYKFANSYSGSSGTVFALNTAKATTPPYRGRDNNHQPDVILYFTYRFDLVSANVCQYHSKSGRPTVININIGPRLVNANFGYPSGSFYDRYNLMIRHYYTIGAFYNAVVLNANHVAQDPSPYLKANLNITQNIATSNANGFLGKSAFVPANEVLQYKTRVEGDTVTMFSSTDIRQWAIDHYQCKNYNITAALGLLGLETITTSIDSYAYYDDRTLSNMIQSYTFTDIAFGNETYMMFQSTGWFDIDWADVPQIKYPYFGAGAGCEFITNKCNLQRHLLAPVNSTAFVLPNLTVPNSAFEIHFPDLNGFSKQQPANGDNSNVSRTLSLLAGSKYSNVSILQNTFCFEPGATRCHVGRRMMANCQTTLYGSPFPSNTQYFPDEPRRGGNFPSTDYCPIYYDWARYCTPYLDTYILNDDSFCFDSTESVKYEVTYGGDAKYSTITGNRSRVMPDMSVNITGWRQSGNPTCFRVVECDPYTFSYRTVAYNDTTKKWDSSGYCYDVSHFRGTYDSPKVFSYGGRTFACTPYEIVCAFTFQESPHLQPPSQLPANPTIHLSLLEDVVPNDFDYLKFVFDPFPIVALTNASATAAEKSANYRRQWGNLTLSGLADGTNADTGALEDIRSNYLQWLKRGNHSFGVRYTNATNGGSVEGFPPQSSLGLWNQDDNIQLEVTLTNLSYHVEFSLPREATIRYGALLTIQMPVNSKLSCAEFLPDFESYQLPTNLFGQVVNTSVWQKMTTPFAVSLRNRTKSGTKEAWQYCGGRRADLKHSQRTREMQFNCSDMIGIVIPRMDLVADNIITSASFRCDYRTNTSSLSDTEAFSGDPGTFPQIALYSLFASKSVFNSSSGLYDDQVAPDLQQVIQKIINNVTASAANMSAFPNVAQTTQTFNSTTLLSNNRTYKDVLIQPPILNIPAFYDDISMSQGPNASQYVFIVDQVANRFNVNFREDDLGPFIQLALHSPAFYKQPQSPTVASATSLFNNDQVLLDASEIPNFGMDPLTGLVTSIPSDFLKMAYGFSTVGTRVADFFDTVASARIAENITSSTLPSAAARANIRSFAPLYRADLSAQDDPSTGAINASLRFSLIRNTIASSGVSGAAQPIHAGAISFYVDFPYLLRTDANQIIEGSNFTTTLVKNDVRFASAYVPYFEGQHNDLITAVSQPRISSFASKFPDSVFGTSKDSASTNNAKFQDLLPPSYLVDSTAIGYDCVNFNSTANSTKVPVVANLSVDVWYFDNYLGSGKAEVWKKIGVANPQIVPNADNVNPYGPLFYWKIRGPTACSGGIEFVLRGLSFQKLSPNTASPSTGSNNIPVAVPMGYVGIAWGPPNATNSSTFSTLFESSPSSTRYARLFASNATATSYTTRLPNNPVSYLQPAYYSPSGNGGLQSLQQPFATQREGNWLANKFISFEVANLTSPIRLFPTVPLKDLTPSSNMLFFVFQDMGSNAATDMYFDISVPNSYTSNSGYLAGNDGNTLFYGQDAVRSRFAWWFATNSTATEAPILNGTGALHQPPYLDSASVLETSSNSNKISHFYSAATPFVNSSIFSGTGSVGVYGGVRVGDTFVLDWTSDAMRWQEILLHEGGNNIEVAVLGCGDAYNVTAVAHWGNQHIQVTIKSILLKNPKASGDMTSPPPLHIYANPLGGHIVKAITKDSINGAASLMCRPPNGRIGFYLKDFRWGTTRIGLTFRYTSTQWVKQRLSPSSSTSNAANGTSSNDTQLVIAPLTIGTLSFGPGDVGLYSMITATVFDQSNCNGRGTRIDNKCRCFAGYGGDKCDVCAYISMNSTEFRNSTRKISRSDSNSYGYCRKACDRSVPWALACSRWNGILNPIDNCFCYCNGTACLKPTATPSRSPVFSESRTVRMTRTLQQTKTINPLDTTTTSTTTSTTPTTTTTPTSTTTRTTTKPTSTTSPTRTRPQTNTQNPTLTPTNSGTSQITQTAFSNPTSSTPYTNTFDPTGTAPISTSYWPTPVPDPTSTWSPSGSQSPSSSGSVTDDPAGTTTLSMTTLTGTVTWTADPSGSASGPTPTASSSPSNTGPGPTASNSAAPTASVSTTMTPEIPNTVSNDCYTLIVNNPRTHPGFVVRKPAGSKIGDSELEAPFRAYQRSRSSTSKVYDTYLFAYEEFQMNALWSEIMKVFNTKSLVAALLPAEVLAQFYKGQVKLGTVSVMASCLTTQDGCVQQYQSLVPSTYASTQQLPVSLRDSDNDANGNVEENAIIHFRFTNFSFDLINQVGDIFANVINNQSNSYFSSFLAVTTPRVTPFLISRNSNPSANCASQIPFDRSISMTVTKSIVSVAAYEDLVVSFRWVLPLTTAGVAANSTLRPTSVPLTAGELISGLTFELALPVDVGAAFMGCPNYGSGDEDELYETEQALTKLLQKGSSPATLQNIACGTRTVQVTSPHPTIANTFTTFSQKVRTLVVTLAPLRMQKNIAFGRRFSFLPLFPAQFCAVPEVSVALSGASADSDSDGSYYQSACDGDAFWRSIIRGTAVSLGLQRIKITTSSASTYNSVTDPAANANCPFVGLRGIQRATSGEGFVFQGAIGFAVSLSASDDLTSRSSVMKSIADATKAASSTGLSASLLSGPYSTPQVTYASVSDLSDGAGGYLLTSGSTAARLQRVTTAHTILSAIAMAIAIPFAPWLTLFDLQLLPLIARFTVHSNFGDSNNFCVSAPASSDQMDAVNKWNAYNSQVDTLRKNYLTAMREQRGLIPKSSPSNQQTIRSFSELQAKIAALGPAPPSPLLALDDQGFTVSQSISRQLLPSFGSAYIVDPQLMAFSPDGDDYEAIRSDYTGTNQFFAVSDPAVASEQSIGTSSSSPQFVTYPMAISSNPSFPVTPDKYFIYKWYFAFMVICIFFAAILLLNGVAVLLNCKRVTRQKWLMAVPSSLLVVLMLLLCGTPYYASNAIVYYNQAHGRSSFTPLSVFSTGSGTPATSSSSSSSISSLFFESPASFIPTSAGVVAILALVTVVLFMLAMFLVVLTWVRAKPHLRSLTFTPNTNIVQCVAGGSFFCWDTLGGRYDYYAMKEMLAPNLDGSDEDANDFDKRQYLTAKQKRRKLNGMLRISGNDRELADGGGGRASGHANSRRQTSQTAGLQSTLLNSEFDDLIDDRNNFGANDQNAATTENYTFGEKLKRLSSKIYFSVTPTAFVPSGFWVPYIGIGGGGTISLTKRLGLPEEVLRDAQPFYIWYKKDSVLTRRPKAPESGSSTNSGLFGDDMDVDLSGTNVTSRSSYSTDNGDKKNGTNNITSNEEVGGKWFTKRNIFSLRHVKALVPTMVLFVRNTAISFVLGFGGRYNQCNGALDLGTSDNYTSDAAIMSLVVIIICLSLGYFMIAKPFSNPVMLLVNVLCSILTIIIFLLLAFADRSMTNVTNVFVSDDTTSTDSATSAATTKALANAAMAFVIIYDVLVCLIAVPILALISSVIEPYLLRPIEEALAAVGGDGANHLELLLMEGGLNPTMMSTNNGSGASDERNEWGKPAAVGRNSRSADSYSPVSVPREVSREPPSQTRTNTIATTPALTVPPMPMQPTAGVSPPPGPPRSGRLATTPPPLIGMEESMDLAEIEAHINSIQMANDASLRALSSPPAPARDGGGGGGGGGLGVPPPREVSEVEHLSIGDHRAPLYFAPANAPPELQLAPPAVAASPFNVAGQPEDLDLVIEEGGTVTNNNNTSGSTVPMAENLFFEDDWER